MSLSAFQLNGKSALVTGSHRGLGAAIGFALAQAGAVVPIPEPSAPRLNGLGV